MPAMNQPGIARAPRGKGPRTKKQAAAISFRQGAARAADKAAGNAAEHGRRPGQEAKHAAARAARQSRGRG